MPTVREWPERRTGKLVTPWQLYGRERILTLFGSIYSSVDLPVITADSVPFLAEEIFGALMLLAQENGEPVSIVINNRGGSVPAGLLIVQAIEHLQAKGIEVRILVKGAAMSMASAVLAAGTEGKRFALNRAVIHLHPGKLTPGEGNPEDIKRIVAYCDKLIHSHLLLLAQRTKIPEYYAKKEDLYETLTLGDSDFFRKEENRLKFVRKFIDGENFLDAAEAKEAGIVDEVLQPGDPRIDEIFRLRHLLRAGGAA